LLALECKREREEPSEADFIPALPCLGGERRGYRRKKLIRWLLVFLGIKKG